MKAQEKIPVKFLQILPSPHRETWFFTIRMYLLF